MSNSADRYDKRKNGGDDLWTVLDMATGSPAEVEGILLTRCMLEQAENLVELLNLEHSAEVRRGMTT